MHITRTLSNDVFYVGADDRRLNLFENLYPVPNGVSYNSYLIMDEKTALLDTVDKAVVPQFEENVRHILGDRELDYLIINHMEPDHGAAVMDMLKRYPSCKLVGNTNTFKFFDQFFDYTLSEERKLLVKEGDTLSLGRHELQFVFAPMVHWPEVMMSYDKADKILFSADAFGTFGALSGNLFDDELDFDEGWLSDARRYYTNIVGKYGPQTQAALKKAAGIDVSMIAPLHGPVWRRDLSMFLGKYDAWSSYRPEMPGSLVVMYASMYGNTKEMAEALSSLLSERGIRNIKLYDVSVTDVSELIAEAFRTEYLVLAAPTYNNGLYPKMRELIEHMEMLNLQKRKVTVLGNGTWAPQAEKIMREMLSSMKGMDVSEHGLTVKSRMKEADREQLVLIAEDIKQRLLGEA